MFKMLNSSVYEFDELEEHEKVIIILNLNFVISGYFGILILAKDLAAC